MALRKTITIPAGTHVENLFPVAGPLAQDYDLADAYIRVPKVGAGRAVATAQVELRTADAEQHVCNLAPVQFAHDRESGAGEITSQAYNHLKTLPEYDGAEDV